MPQEQARKSMGRALCCDLAGVSTAEKECCILAKASPPCLGNCRLGVSKILEQFGVYGVSGLDDLRRRNSVKGENILPLRNNLLLNSQWSLAKV